MVVGAWVVEVTSSRQPQKLPGVLQVDVEVADDVDESEVVVVLSLQPNHPGVLQVDVEDVDVDVVVDDSVVDVVVSKHPHHPGVSHVDVRVRVLVVLVEECDVVVVSVPFDSYIFQGAQSRHSGV